MTDEDGLDLDHVGDDGNKVLYRPRVTSNRHTLTKIVLKA